MLKTLKNRLFRIITDNGLSLELFEWQEYDNDFLITFADTPLNFSMKQSEKDFNQFLYTYTSFLPGYPVRQSTTYFDFSVLEKSFRNWVENDVRNIQEEIDAPDFWKQHETLADAIPSPAPPEDEFKEFTEDEKNQIRVSIDEFRLSVEENFQLIEEQLKDFNERLDYLSNAVDRLNKFDWRALLITTSLDIIIAFSLDPEGRRRLYELLQQTFSGVIGLLT